MGGRRVSRGYKLSQYRVHVLCGEALPIFRDETGDDGQFVRRVCDVVCVQLYFETRREEVRTRRVGNRASFVGRSEVVFERHERKQNRKRVWEEQ